MGTAPEGLPAGASDCCKQHSTTYLLQNSVRSSLLRLECKPNRHQNANKGCEMVPANSPGGIEQHKAATERCSVPGSTIHRMTSDRLLPSPGSPLLPNTSSHRLPCIGQNERCSPPTLRPLCLPAVLQPGARAC